MAPSTPRSALLLCAALAILSASARSLGVPAGVQAPETPTMSTILAPMSSSAFMADVYGKKVHHFSRNDESQFSSLYSRHDLPTILDLFRADDVVRNGIQVKLEGEKKPALPKNVTAEMMQSMLDIGYGMVVRFEDLRDESHDPFKAFEDDFVKSFGFTTTVHLYLAGKQGSRTLAPHTDPYDVIVLQLSGSKDWTTCVPQPRMADSIDAELTEAELAQLMEIERSNVQGCTSWTDADLARMECRTFTMHAGDSLYMPKGIVHYALAGPEGSHHLTLSVDRKGVSWDGLLAGVANRYLGEHRGLVRSALQRLIKTHAGLGLYDTLPMWLVAGEGNATTPAPECDDPSDAACFRPLYAHYAALVDTLGAHLLDAPQAGAGQSYSAAAAPQLRKQLVAALKQPDAFAYGIAAVRDQAQQHPRYPHSGAGSARHGQRERRAAPSGGFCNTGCDTSCDVFTGSCDSGCDTGCNVCTGSCDTACDTGCTAGCDTSCDTLLGCDSSCDGSCTSSSCDSSCDSSLSCDSSCDSGCTAGCDSSCDTPTSCDSSCDSGCTSTSCDGSCNGCNGGCDSSCDFLGRFGCDSSCDSSCDFSCDTSCDSRTCNSGCDSSCDSSISCDSSCDTCYSGCDSSCDTPTSCDSSCDTRTCNSGCDSSCDTQLGCDASCDTCYSGCDSGCDSNCPCTTGCDLSCDSNPTSCDSGCDTGCGCYAGSAYIASSNTCRRCVNSYADVAGLTSCKACPSCPALQFRTGCGGASPGRCTACAGCAAGTFRTGCSGLATGSCAACPTGTFKTDSGNGACLACGSCAAGFTRSGCGGTSPGQCIGVSCASLGNPGNGAVGVSNGGRFPATATYSCAAGYALSSTASRSCQTNGQWGGSAPRCIAQSCETLSNPANGRVSSATCTFPCSVTYTCNAGYTRSGAATRTCGSNLRFSGSAPTCRAITCAALAAPANGVIAAKSNSGRYPSTASFGCNPGYVSSNAGATRACQTDGSWAGTTPTCSGRACDALAAPANGARTVTNGGRFPASATFRCSAGYALSSAAVLTCLTTGKWNRAAPACAGIQCDALVHPSNGLVSALQSQFPASVSYSCKPGFQRTGGSARRTCQTSGAWSGAAAQCSACPADEYKASSADSPCLACPSNSVTAGRTAQTGCECRAGFGTASSFASCAVCARGSFKGGVGNTACAVCATGSTTGGTGATACVPKACPPLPSIQHGAVAFSSATFPATATYSCQAGFQLAAGASATRACSSDSNPLSATGWAGSAPACTPVCGDGLHLGTEQCDDGNTAAGDGCDANCQIEPGFSCTNPNQACKFCEMTSVGSDQTATCETAATALAAWRGIQAGAQALTETQCGAHVWSDRMLSSTGPASCRTETWEFTLDYAERAGHPDRFDKTTHNFVVTDATAPTLSNVPAAATVQCDAVPAAAAAGVTAADNCDTAAPAVTVAETRLGGRCPNAFGLTRTWTATDACGNPVSASQALAVIDSVPPRLNSAAQDAVAECDGNGNAAERQTWLDGKALADATDSCAGAITWTNDWAPAKNVVADGNPATYTATVAFTATDVCGNSAPATSAKFTVEDTADPAFTNLPADVTVECDAVPAMATVAASDTCDAAAAVAPMGETRADTPGSCRFEYTLTRQWRASDAAGNTRDGQQVVTVQSTVAPTLSQPAGDQTVECDGNGNAAQLDAWLKNSAGAAAAGACGGAIAFTHDFSAANFVTACNGATKAVDVTFTATDECGNAVTTKAAFTIEDTTNPSINNVPADAIVQCDAVPALATPGVSDTCSSGLAATPTETTVQGSCPDHVYVLTRSWATADACGNTDSAVQTIEVRDDSPPTVTSAPQSMTVQCDPSVHPGLLTDWLASSGSGAAADSCGGPVTWTHVLDPVNNKCGVTFEQDAAFSAADACGNPVTHEATFDVVDDTPPLISGVPLGATVECSAIPSPATPTAADQCSGDLSAAIAFTEARGELSCPFNFMLTRTWAVSDPCANTDTQRQVLVVEDTMAPALSAMAQPLVLECGPDNDAALAAYAAANGQAAALDACSGANLTWTNDLDAQRADLRLGCAGLTGQTNVTFTATDQCQNAASTTASVTIADTTPPAITTPAANATFECAPANNTLQLAAFIASLGGAAATDSCRPEAVAWTHATSAADLCGETLLTQVDFTATDACGNTATTTAFFEVVDETVPELRLSPAPPTERASPTDPLHQLAEAGFPWRDPGVEFAGDACHPELTAEHVVVTPPASTSVEANLTAAYSITDACGNGQTLVRNVRFVDRIPPSITLGGSGRVLARIGVDFVDPFFTAADAVTAGAELGLDVDVASTADVGVGSHLVTYTAVDGAGNVDLAFRRLRVLGASPANRRRTLRVAFGLGRGTPLLDAPISPPVGFQAWALTTAATAADFRLALGSLRPFADLHVECLGVDALGHDLCQFEAEFLGQADLAALAAHPDVVAVSPSVSPVLGFQGVGRGSDDAEFSLFLERTGHVGVTSVSCDPDAEQCAYTTTARHFVLSDEGPKVAPTFQSRLTVSTGLARFALFSALYSAGILPQHIAPAGNGSFVVHTRGLAEEAVASVPGLTVTAAETFTMLEFAISLSAPKSAVEVVRELLDVGIVPQSITGGGAGAGGLLQPIVIRTTSSVFDRQRDLLLKGQTAFSDVSAPTPVALQSTISADDIELTIPFNASFPAEAAANTTDIEAILAQLTDTFALTSEGLDALVYTLDTTPTASILDALDALPGVLQTSFTGTSALNAGLASLRAGIRATLGGAFDEADLSIEAVAAPTAATGRRRGRRAVAAESTFEVVFDPASGGLPSVFEGQFALVAGANLTQASVEALISATWFNLTGTLPAGAAVAIDSATRQVTVTLGQDVAPPQIANLQAHPEVEPNSVIPPHLLHSMLASDEAFDLVMEAFETNQLQVVVEGLQVQPTAASEVLAPAPGPGPQPNPNSSRGTNAASSLGLIAGVVVAAILLIVIVLVVALRRSSKSAVGTNEVDTADRAVVAFVNPIYDDEGETKQNPLYNADDDTADGLYDEPAFMAQAAHPGRAKMSAAAFAAQAAANASGYLDIAPDTGLETYDQMDASGAPAIYEDADTGGYLDVHPEPAEEEDDVGYGFGGSPNIAYNAGAMPLYGDADAGEPLYGDADEAPLGFPGATLTANPNYETLGEATYDDMEGEYLDVDADYN